MRILIIGCGSIGSVLAKAVHEMPEVDRIYVTDQSRDYAVHLIGSLDKAEYVDHVNGNIAQVLGEVNLAVEAASQEAARKYVPMILENGVDVMVMSVGVFADDAFRERCFTLARKHRSRIYVPSGAVCGTDGLHSAAAANVREVHLITRKGPKGLRGAPGLRDIDVDTLTEPTVVFEGNARDAANLFPKNLNVAATVSLLGVGFDQTRVTIICDPTTEKNSHTLVVQGDFGELRCETQNVPSPMTPSTSYLAALSAVAAIKRILGNVWIGV